jgi:2-oxoglutarate ferredoxin oxidoreductase subunit alpha
MLMDKQFSELSGTHGKLKSPEIKRGKFLETPPADYKRYELTADGISPRVEVGTPNGDFIATSYEHDEYGATSEDPEVKKAMTEKRWRKLSNFYADQNIM